MKRWIIIMLVMVIAFSTAACSYKTKPTGDTQNNQIQNKKEITLYFPNKEYITTGNEELPKVLPEKRMVVATENMPKTVVEELLKGPTSTNLDKLPATIRLIDVKVKDNIAYVDFSREGLSGGSIEESLLIESIVTSLAEINIKQVQFLVDGKIVETLMGHIDARSPISK